jgi:drug/metabolite transporter (DMT)-like permease
MPLADTLAFWMAVPIFLAVASALLLREPLGAMRLGAIATGFVGVALALGARFACRVLGQHRLYRTRLSGR